ncbi:MAG TPA: NUDIX hydrolase [Bacteroidia bacterium]|mgnify:CR=1 FL=1|nr:NUDIX hydrolase [Bacteroidia bacterium]
MKTHNPWQTLSVKKIFDSPWIELELHDVINPSGNKGIYNVVKFKHLAIGILPIDEEGYTYLVGQWRYPLNQYSWEIPEGGGKLDVEPLESAKRELLEETGLVAHHYEELLRLHTSNSVTNELAIIYLAKNLEQKESNPEETEDITIKKIHLKDALKMVMNNEITDSLSVAAILKASIKFQLV